MKPESFSIRARAQSFRFAWEGIMAFVKREHNAWLHYIATVAVVILAAVAGLSKTEWLALVFVIGFVWVAEIFNTCIERTMDLISTERRPEIKFIKDLAAGGVLVAAIIALVTGCIIFIPKIL